MFLIRFRYIYILLLSLYSFINIRVTVGTKLFDFELHGAYLFAVLTIVIAGVWELNRLVDKSQQQRILRVHPLILLFVASMFNVVLISTLALLGLYVVLGKPLSINFDHWKLLTAFGFRVNLFLNSINAIVFFMNRLKKTQLEAEQLKKQNIEAQFEALRNQINPHFLFNCFNVLSTLVHKDAEASSKFISQLSHVYRYLLYNQEKKLVSLKEELLFLESYTYLLKTRFNESIAVENRISETLDQLMVAPASLQMLIENAIKHNIASKKNPLRIVLEKQDNYIVVRNTLQKKEIAEESTKIGLKNIISRYKLLADLPVEVEKTLTEFVVRLPILKLDK
ncbi:MAG: histidine kinase [Cyclobacteriaceae bacterium]|nr:histidine kinase [Cyclobacteriaceae bacterium]